MPTKKKDNLKRIRLEFFKLTGILLRHPTNRVRDRFLRKDKVFDALARRLFDNPDLLPLLMKKQKQWLKLDQSELTFCLSGYLYYCGEDFPEAERYFLKAVNKNAQNLDNWFDLAFSLYHQEKEKQELAIKIFFNFDKVAFLFSGKKITLESLAKMSHA